MQKLLEISIFESNMSQTQSLHQEAMHIAHQAYTAQREGDNIRYLQLLKTALEKEKTATWQLFHKTEAEPTRSVLFRSAAWLAFQYRQPREAEQLISAALSGNPPKEIIQELRTLYKEVLGALEVVV